MAAVTHTAEAYLNDAEKGRFECKETDHMSIEVLSEGDHEPVSVPKEGSMDERSPVQADIITPYNWPRSRKITIAMTVSLAQLVATSSGSFMAPALHTIAVATDMSSTTAQISFSIYMLGLGIVPFFAGPASEVFGRKPTWLAGTIFYAVCNALCPLGSNKVVLIVFRFLSGVGASAGVVLTGPILADMFRKEQRGMAIAIGTVLPYLGPALGPIIGGLLSQYVAWQWLFWMMSIFEAAVIVLGYLIIRETYGPVLERKRKQQQQQQRQANTANGQVEALEDEAHTLATKTLNKFILPLRLLVYRPIVQLVSLLNGISFGIYILVLSFYATLYTKQYHETPTISSLHYIAIALGAITATQSGGRFVDWSYAYLTKRSGRTSGEPEYRIPLLAIGSLIEVIGLFWLGWSAQAGITWIMVDIGTFVFTVGDFMTAQAALTYILDEFGTDSASANGAVRILSYVLAFALPLPAPAMFDRLGYGWGSTLLAGVFVVFAAPMTCALWFWGPSIRALGRGEGDGKSAQGAE